jgi:hypothetical protein
MLLSNVLHCFKKTKILENTNTYILRSPYSSVSKLHENCHDLKTKEAGLDFWQGRDTFLFSKEPIKALGPTQLPIKWA